ncbi:hypothetical protein PEBR_11286 [Penicillium brasilianum]|uniref:CHAT domain-containing protein n=1 Tax=Penicillium brasilianum TaxID=104259 RepID=A0A1S9RT95_PENBI|nr:hypothetical protein PEBR_11286 [Penicillium brasilianum]
MHIFCRQIEALSTRSWRAVISGDGQERTIVLQDPFKLEAEERLVKWYIEDFVNTPFSKYRARAAAAVLRRYGKSLWQQLGIDTAGSLADSGCPRTITLNIIMSDDQNSIDKIYWELLESLDTIACPIIIHRTLHSHIPSTALRPLRTLSIDRVRVLVVSARSQKRSDVDPRLTSLPLVQTLAGKSNVDLVFVHSGTFEEFERKLDSTTPSEKIDLVHFDLHGRVDREKGSVLEFFDTTTKHRKSYAASAVAKVLQRNGVQWAVLCACRTAQTTSTFSHLALEFLNHGITGVFAMRYELKAAAAKILTSSFYDALCKKGKTFTESGYAARRALQAITSRPARFDEIVEVQDSLVPAIYTAGGNDFRLEEFTTVDSIAASSFLKSSPLPEMIGREDDIRRLSALMREEKSFLNVVSDIGNGKSTLMEHLTWWWKEIKLFSRIIYVNIPLTRSERNDDGTFGCLAIANCIYRAVDENRIPNPSCSDPIRILAQAMESSKGQDVIVLLDGLDQIYPYLSINSCEDTAQSWSDFLRMAKLLSTTGFKLVVTSSVPLPIVADETSDFLFALSTRMTNEEVLHLLYPPNTASSQPKHLKKSTDTHLHCVFELLQYNRVALKSQSGKLRGKFHGLDAILLWDGAFDEHSTYGIRANLMESRVTELQSLNLNDDCGLGRVHSLLLVILDYLAKDKRYEDLWALLSIGLWIDSIPHPSQIMEIFEGDNLQLRVPIIQYIVDNIPKSQLNSSCLPFELWSIMRDSSVMEKKTQSNSQSLPVASKITMSSMQNAIQLLMAARLITGRTETLIDGMKGYKIHPAATLWLRRILLVLPYHTVLLNIYTCMGSRAYQMADLNPNEAEIKSGNASHLRAIQSPSFPFIEREKWNLITAVGKMRHDAAQLQSNLALVSPENDLNFAWLPFMVLIPISFAAPDFCPLFLTHVALEYLASIEPQIPQSYLDPLPGEITMLPLMHLLITVVLMVQRYRLDNDLPVPLRIRRLLLARVEAIRDADIDCDEINEDEFILMEISHWLNEAGIAIRSPECDKLKISRIFDKVNVLKQQCKSSWDMRFKIATTVMECLPQGEYDPQGGLTNYRDDNPEDPERLPDHASMLPLALHALVGSLMPPSKGDGISSSSDWMTDIYSFMAGDLEFEMSTPPWYTDQITPVFNHLRNRNIEKASAAALRALDTAEKDGNILLTSNLRHLCRRLADLDTIDEYDKQQTQLARTAERSAPFLRDLLLNYLAGHDTPGAYQYVKHERTKLEASLPFIRQLMAVLPQLDHETIPESVSAFWKSTPHDTTFMEIGLIGMDQLAELLEPFKDERLEDKMEWVRLIQGIWDLMDKLVDQNTPSDRAWMLKLYEVYPERGDARGYWHGHRDVLDSNTWEDDGHSHLKGLI